MLLEMIWVPMGLFAAFMTAVMLYVSEHFKVPPTQFLMGLRFFSFFLLLPFALMVDWPEEPLFYIVTFTAILIIAGMDILMIGTAVKHGAGVTTRILPLSAFTTFFLWTAYSPDTLQTYMAQPVRSIGIVLAVAGAAYFAVKLRHCEVSREAMKTLIPAVLMASVVSVFGKIAVDTAPDSGPVLWGFIQACTLSLFYAGAVYGFPHKVARVPINKAFLTCAILAALTSSAHIVVKAKAFHMVENPAYVMILLLTTPLWILLFYRAKKHEEKADIWAGLGVVASAFLLILFTGL